MYYLSIFFNQEQEADPPKEDSIRYSVIPYISNITLLHITMTAFSVRCRRENWKYGSARHLYLTNVCSNWPFGIVESLQGGSIPSYLKVSTSSATPNF